MNKVNFEFTPGDENVDTVAGVIRNVAIITAGLVARGHDLEVDKVTLQQMFDCAQAKRSVPVKIDHRSGAAAIVGYLQNFRIAGEKLLADWYLLESHPQRNQILEVARRMPSGAGLSASFVSPDGAEPGKARCAELVSVDVVCLPAANPDGFFSAKPPRRPGAERLLRALRAGAGGAEIGALGGTLASAALRNRPKAAAAAPLAGAVLGGVTAAALRARRDQQDEEQRHFEQRPVINKISEAVARNLPEPTIPGQDEAELAIQASKRPYIRKIAVRVAKIGAGAVAGHYAGRRLGSKAGAVVGGTAGALLSARDVERIEFSTTTKPYMNSTSEKLLHVALDRHSKNRNDAGMESHSLHSLAARVALPVDQTEQLLKDGVLQSHGPVYARKSQHLHQFAAADLNAIRESSIEAVAQKAIQDADGDPDQVAYVARRAVDDHVKQFGMRLPSSAEGEHVEFAAYNPDDEPSVLKTAAKVGAVGALGYGAGALLRGRRVAPGAGLLNQIKAGAIANNATLTTGAQRVLAMIRGQKVNFETATAPAAPVASPVAGFNAKQINARLQASAALRKKEQAQKNATAKAMLKQGFYPSVYRS